MIARSKRQALAGLARQDVSNDHWRPLMLELIAYHEAGHTLVACLLGGRVRQVTIEPDRDDGPQRQGDTQVIWRRTGISEKDYAVKAVQVSLAGPVAEMIYSGDPYHPGLISEWAADWREAWSSAEILHADDRQRLAYLESVSIQLYHELNEDPLWAALAALADDLLAHETLDGEQVEEIVGTWLG
jgi:ATP-dependent Zn protease